MQLLTTHFARILFALPFAIFGWMHLMSPDELSILVPDELPGGPQFYIYMTGIVEIVCAGAIILKKYDDYAAVVLAILLLLYVLFVHIPSTILDSNQFSDILKDLALAGAALFYAGTRTKK